MPHAVCPGCQSKWVAQNGGAKCYSSCGYAGWYFNNNGVAACVSFYITIGNKNIAVDWDYDEFATVITMSSNLVGQLSQTIAQLTDPLPYQGIKEFLENLPIEFA